MRRLLLAAAAAGFAAAAPLAAQSVERGAFIVRIGTDTVAVERFTRTGRVLTVDQVVHAPATTVRHWTLSTDADGRARSFVSDAHRATGTVPPTHTEITFGRDTAVLHYVSGPRDTTVRIAATDAFPYVGSSYAAIEPLLMRARAARGATYAGRMVAFGQAGAIPLPVTFVGRDSVTFALGSPDLYRARVDAGGHILGLSGAATTQKFDVVRVTDVDVAAVAATWAKRDASGATMGVLSPTDSVVATAGGATLRVVYSRPSLRGRTLMGYLIPYDGVWRTGANAATMFTTSADLVVGGQPVPAGSYTLWTMATPQGAQLVINRQTGQWGTDYDAKQDLARVPLAVAAASPPREQFTFAIEPAADGGTLAYMWGDRRFSVPFTVKQ